MPGGKKGLRKGSSPSERPHKAILSPKDYECVIVGTIRNVIKNLKDKGMY